MLERLQGSRAALDDSVRAQRQLVADASHELRTPVTSLRTNIEVLLEGGQLERRGPAPAARRCRRAERGAERAGRRSDRPRARRPPARARPRTRGSTGSSRTQSRGRGATRRASSSANSLDPVDRRGRPRAARAGGQQPARQRRPPLAARRRRRGRRRLATGVRVRDHGAGVDAADLPHVFDRFFRGANSRGQQGSGLGLAIVRQVAEQHGGSVSAANAADGGAIFTHPRCRRRRSASERRGSRQPRNPRLSARRLKRALRSCQNSSAIHRPGDRRAAAAPGRASIADQADHGRSRARPPGSTRAASCASGSPRSARAPVTSSTPSAQTTSPTTSVGVPPLNQPHDDRDEPGEDRDLRDRHAAERARRPLALGPELAAGRAAARGSRRSSTLGALLAPRRRHRARRPTSGFAACASAALTSARPRCPSRIMQPPTARTAATRVHD